ncbi:MAG: hypothetical protein F6K10_10405 [Moorea sp. SIO2B7]|nr:hypothetical protein [Moorena sp. SIO2B7]
MKAITDSSQKSSLTSYLYINGDLEKAWKRYRQTIEPKTWKQSVEPQPSTGRGDDSPTRNTHF